MHELGNERCVPGCLGTPNPRLGRSLGTLEPTGNLRHPSSYSASDTVVSPTTQTQEILTEKTRHAFASSLLYKMTKFAACARDICVHTRSGPHRPWQRPVSQDPSAGLTGSRVIRSRGKGGGGKVYTRVHINTNSLRR